MRTQKIFFWAAVFGIACNISLHSSVGLRPSVTVSPSLARERARPGLTETDLSFDLATTPINSALIPTVEKFSTEVSILINNLYRRRELDEINVRSLMRIRAYLAFIYRRTKQTKLQNRIKEAVREINEELAHRFNFQKRYAEGLIKAPKKRSVASIETQTEKEPFVKSGPETVVIKSDRAALSASTTSLIKVESSPSLQENLASTYNARGKRLAALIDRGLLDPKELNDEDQKAVTEYRRQRAAQKPLDSVPKRPLSSPSTPLKKPYPSSVTLPENFTRSIIEGRGKRLYAFLGKNYIQWDQMDTADQNLVRAYQEASPHLPKIKGST